MRRKLISIVVAIIFALFFYLPKAGAIPITIAITAEVTELSDDYNVLEGQVEIGDIMTGTYTYDTSTPDLAPGPIMGRYEYYSPPYGISLNVGGFDFETDPADVYFFLVILDNLYTKTGTYDYYYLRSENNLPLHNGTVVGDISWELRDSSFDALSSDALPTTAPVLDDWDESTGILMGGQDFYIRANVTEAVPELATLLLLGFGSLALLRKRRA